MAEDYTEPQGGDRIGSGLTDSAGSPAGKVEDHVSEGLDFLLEQFKTKPRVEAFLSVLLDQVQDLENVLWDLYTKRTLDDSEGVQLDGLGDIVGEERANRTDAVYRRFIRVRILVNHSNGQPEELYAIGLLALEGTPDPVLRIWEQQPKSITINLDVDITGRDITAAQMTTLFRQAKDAGVKLAFVYQVDPDTFTWGDSNNLGTSATTGWGDVPGGPYADGGHWASVNQG